MKKWLKTITTMAGCFVGVISQTACINDDLRDCDNNYELDYELRLVTNMTTELHTELTTETDLQIAQTLRGHLSGIFTDFAHDVDLSFYDTHEDSVRLQHDEHIMDANQASYTLNLPKRQYMHLAAANLVNNREVNLIDDEHCHTSVLQQTKSDTITSHTTGLFTARQPMEVLEGIDQNFNVHLYMANCATTLIVDTVGSGISDLQVFATGFATTFNMADSIYNFQQSPIIRSDEVDVGNNIGQQVFCVVSFPSKEIDGTRTIIETTDPFVTEGGTGGLWELRTYATANDGKKTETVLAVSQPLRAGQLRIIKARLLNNGALSTDDRHVGVSVTLDWNQGTEYNPEL